MTSIEDVSRAIIVLRGRKVLLDVELAALYSVTTKRLNEQYGAIANGFHRFHVSTPPRRPPL